MIQSKPLQSKRASRLFVTVEILWSWFWEVTVRCPDMPVGYVRLCTNTPIAEVSIAVTFWFLAQLSW
jgi:hypothetical protein